MDENEFREKFPPPPPIPGPPPLERADTVNLTLRNALKQRFTAEEVDSVMLRFQGNPGMAAMHLSVPVAHLKKFLRGTLSLNKWIPVKTNKGKVIPALKAREEALDKPAMGGESPISLPDKMKIEDLVKIAEEENVGIREGLIKLGTTEAQASQLLEMGKHFKLRHLDSAMGFASMGIAVNLTKQLELMRNLEDRIKVGEFKCNEKGDPSEESMVYEAYVALSEECRRTADFWLKTQLTIARIESIKRAEAKAGKPTTKAGFKPKAINIVTA